MNEPPHPQPWSIVARNLVEHANNPIHTDAGAQAAGFPRALVAGVTSYAYCLHPVLERWGPAWVEHGSAEVRFRSPLFDGDHASFPVTEPDDAPGAMRVEATVAGAGQPLVVVNAQLPVGPGGAAEPRVAEPRAAEQRVGEVLLPMQVRLEGEYGSHYAQRAGDDLDICVRHNIVHPAVWPALANYVFHRQLARGSWIHTRSAVRHVAAARPGAMAEIHTTVVKRFERNGHRAVCDVVITADGAIVATLEHEAIIEVAPHAA